MKHLFTGLAFCLATIAGFAQCEADHTVEASNFLYAPMSLTIEQGESVAFFNIQGFHDVNGVTNSITGEAFNNPADFSLNAVSANADGACMGVVTFDVPGTYSYDCSIGSHAAQGMVGSITVNALPTNTVVDVIVNSPDHELLEAAVLAADLAGALSAEGPFTVFAPTDEAIGALVAALGITAEDLLALENLGDILTYHVVAGEALSTSLTDGQMIATLLGPDVTVTITDDGTFINDAMVTVADIPADNGVVHVIDAVLSPPVVVTNTVVDVIVNSPDHELLEAAVLAADLAGALSAEGPFTVFAPTDEAIGALVATLGITAEELLALETLGDILTYHVVAGEALSTSLTDGQMIATLLGPDVTVTITDDGTYINDALVTVADIPADNGVVHVIDAVLLPPAPVTTTIWDIVENSDDHTYLEAALLQQGLDGALNDTTVLTLFAPTDAAFEAAAAAYGTDIAGLLALPYLTDILLYHVTGGAVMSTDLSDGQVVTMLNEGTTTVTIDMGVFINNAQVTSPDLTADNGVVHVLDALIQPAPPVATTIWDIVEGSPVHTYLEAALLQEELDGALNDTTDLTLFAPTDAAFEATAAALGTDIAGILALPNLTDILLYHVTAGAVLSTDLSDGLTVGMLNDAEATITIDENGVFVNDAQVTTPDLTADNGVVHVIDGVLLPPTDGIQEAQVSWTVMPNPASDEVRFAGLAAEATVVVLDLTGRQVAQLAAGNNILAVGHMAPGTYLVAVTANGTITTSKLVVR